MFKIMSSYGAVSQHQVKKEISGLDARNIMQNSIRVETAKINNSWYGERIDINDAQKKLKDLKRNYDRTAPESLSIESKNIMWKRAKQLKDEFTVDMLSYDELHPVKSFQVDGKINVVIDEERMRTIKSVERNTVWYNRNQNKISEYKNIMRHLNPDNPSASDIERFRPYNRST